MRRCSPWVTVYRWERWASDAPAGGDVEALGVQSSAQCCGGRGTHGDRADGGCQPAPPEGVQIPLSIRLCTGELTPPVQLSVITVKVGGGQPDLTTTQGLAALVFTQ